MLKVNLLYVFMQKGKLKAVLGASGGLQIIPATTEVFLNHFVHQMEPLAAVMAPRFYVSIDFAHYNFHFYL